VRAPGRIVMLPSGIACAPTIAESAVHTRPGPAMIDRLVHHAEVISLEGDSYQL
jgi:hypothetical protein